MTAIGDLDTVCYAKNYLKQVIVRIDFVSPVLSLAAELPKNVAKAALQHFPIDEPKPSFTQEVILSAKELQTRKQEFTEWNFFGRNREKRLVLTPQAIFAAYERYEKYENLRNEFRALADVFFQECADAQPSRLGLRYINEVKSPGGNPLEWGKFIDESLLGLFSYSIDRGHPARIFHNYEVVFDRFNLRFHFGVHNPDYPAPIRQPIFILDFDAYYQGLLEPNDLPEALDSFHHQIQRLFERSITDDLREVLHDQS